MNTIAMQEATSKISKRKSGKVPTPRRGKTPTIPETFNLFPINKALVAKYKEQNPGVGDTWLYNVLVYTGLKGLVGKRALAFDDPRSQKMLSLPENFNLTSKA